MSGMDVASRIVLKLEGAEAQRGIPLTALENFVERFSRALVDFDRTRRGQQTRKSGRRTAREELVVGFRVVELRPGSAIMELEPLTIEEAGQADEPILHVEMLAVENLRALLDAVENSDTPLDPDVTQSLEAARRSLGAEGRIGVSLEAESGDRRVLIDEVRVEELAGRKPRAQEIVSAGPGRKCAPVARQ
jgi:hypothetical protein